MKNQGIGDRLLKVMEVHGFNPNSFSVHIGVLGPTTDKIIKGKNNPGYEYLCKVLVSFPEVSARWLLLGEGAMLGEVSKFRPGVKFR